MPRSAAGGHHPPAGTSITNVPLYIAHGEMLVQGTYDGTQTLFRVQVDRLPLDEE